MAPIVAQMKRWFRQIGAKSEPVIVGFHDNTKPPSGERAEADGGKKREKKNAKVCQVLI